MATLKIDKEEVHVSNVVVDSMTGRLWKLGSDARRAAFVARARERLTAGHRGRNDIATVIVADHGA